MLTGSQNNSNNSLFSNLLTLAKSQDTEESTQSKIKIFELLNSFNVTQVKIEDILAAIVLSNNMGSEKINEQTSLNMLELIFDIPSVKQKMAENGYDILFCVIELGDTYTLDILKKYPEINETLHVHEEEFLNLAEEYFHENVTEWISQQKQNRKRNKLS